ncbi:MAG: hypothetical protein R2932_16550 [Caldilineaceae bacterium]
MATIQDVATKAGVAPITVSRAQQFGVCQPADPAARQHGQGAGLCANSPGSSLRSNRTHILAMLLADISNPFWTTVKAWGGRRGQSTWL